MEWNRSWLVGCLVPLVFCVIIAGLILWCLVQYASDKQEIEQAKEAQRKSLYTTFDFPDENY